MSLELILSKAEAIQKAIKDSGYFPNDLEGACAVASTELFNYGQSLGLPIQFAYNELWHCFNLFDNNGELLIIDITASQFNPDYLNKIAIQSYEYYKSRYYWYVEGLAKDRQEFDLLAKEKLRFEDRWYNQNPFIYSFTENKTLKLMMTAKISF